MPLEIKLSISKNDCDEEQEKGMSTKDTRMTKSLAADEDTKLYKMDVESSGKYFRKATWEDLNRYTGKEISPDVLRDWVVHYQERCFPEGEFF